jgi:hypothetical protein
MYADSGVNPFSSKLFCEMSDVVARDAKMKEDLEEMKDIMAGFKDCPAVEEMNSLIAKWLLLLEGKTQ